MAAFVAVNLLLVAASVFALRQNVTLRNEINYDQALLTPRNGTVVPPLVGQDWQGAQQTIEYGHDRRPTLVYTFSKDCAYCQKNWRAMRTLQALAPGRLRIIYIDAVRDLFTFKYLAENGIGQSQLLVQLPLSSEFVYGARAVPQLLLVDRDGLVQWSHVGELGRDDVSKVLSLIEHD
ncbi:MAG: hypothetical protein WAL69_05490 [Candidatus Acidiferrales bacterium]